MGDQWGDQSGHQWDDQVGPIEPVAVELDASDQKPGRRC